jgi:tetratricopeptide (TPR) repeat protein
MIFLGGASLLASGCGNPSEAEAARKAADEANRAQRFEDRYVSGKKAFDEGRFDAAVADLEQADRLRDDPEVHALLILALKARDDARRAAYEQLMERGDRSLHNHDYQDAIAAFHGALSKRPGDREATNAIQKAEFQMFLEQGQTALASKQYAEAIQAFREAVKRHDAEERDSVELLKKAEALRRTQLMDLGSVALGEKRYWDAVRLLGEANQLGTDEEVKRLVAESSFQAHLQRGRHRFNDRQFAAAISDLEVALQIQRDHPQAIELLSQAKEQKRRQDQLEYDHFMQVGDAALLQPRKDYTAAINAYRQALSRVPNDPLAAARLNESLQGLQEKNRKDKQEYDHFMQVGDAALQQPRKEYQAAINAYREALVRIPNDPQVTAKLNAAQSAKAKKDSYDGHMKQGNVQMTSRNYKLAEIEFRAALIDIPNDPDAERALKDAIQKGKAKK